jgi:O-acetyl-ADP-ribose deacetylase (regulator of RNase III)
MSASDDVECPLCFVSFPATSIQAHAAQCTGLDSDQHDTAPAPRGGRGGGGRGGGRGVRGGGGGADLGDRPSYDLVACPVCNEQYPAAVIQEHAAQCRGPGGAFGTSMDTTASGSCHGRCGRPGNSKYAGYCITCLNKRGGITALRPKLIQRHSLNSRAVDVCQGDITLETAEAIVNPANSKLDHASGVAGALRHAAGEEMIKDSQKALEQFPDKKLPVGDAVMTRGGGALQCRYVIHVVGPTWKDGKQGEHAQLARCILRALQIADEQKLISIAIPAVSSGIFGFPKTECARVILDSIFSFLDANPDSPLRSIRLTNIDDETVAIFRSTLGVEPRPLTSILRWVAGEDANKQILRVCHGSTYALQRTAASGSVVVVDYCNANWDLITPHIEDLTVRSAMQDEVRKKVALDTAAAAAAAAGDGAEGAQASVSLGDGPRAVAVAQDGHCIAIAACRSNKFDQASYDKLVQSVREAIAVAATRGSQMIAIPLVGAGVLAYSSTLAARAALQAASEVLRVRGQKGSPALDIALCEGPDTAFFVDELRSRWVVPPEHAKTPADALATFSPAPPLTFAVAPSASAGATTAAAAPPANETPAERRARLRREAEERFEMQRAMENP